jgi:hypothetical protein
VLIIDGSENLTVAFKIPDILRPNKDPVLEIVSAYIKADYLQFTIHALNKLRATTQYELGSDLERVILEKWILDNYDKQRDAELVRAYTDREFVALEVEEGQEGTVEDGGYRRFILRIREYSDTELDGDNTPGRDARSGGRGF